MKKIVLSLAILAAASSASFAAQRGVDPDVTLNGKALTSVSAPASGASSALAIDNANGDAFARLQQNAADYQSIR